MKRFISIECPNCGYTQEIFSKPSINVKCNSCGTVVAEPRGGIGRFRGRILK